jgi:hypothetical protein
MAAGPIPRKCTHLAGLPSRKAVLALRTCQVTIKQPQTNLTTEAKKLPLEVVLSFVEVREIDSPANATPTHRRLLTAHAVTALADAKEIPGFYRHRWAIDELFRVMRMKVSNFAAVRRQCAVREAGIAA